MRKKIIKQTVEGSSPADQNWLDLARLAQVEITSENEAYPIESALTPGIGPGWQAAQPGPQTIRLIFDQPQRLKRIYLIFPEEEVDILRAHLSRLMGDPDLRADLARRGRERVLARFTQAQVAAQTYQVYRAVLSA